MTSQKEMAALMSTQQQKYEGQLKKMQEQLSEVKTKMVQIVLPKRAVRETFLATTNVGTMQPL